MEREDETIEPGPPPVPTMPMRDDALAGASAAPVGRSARPRILWLLVVALLAAVGGFLGGLAASEVLSVPDLLRSPAALEADRDAELVGLLEDIIRTEGVMLAFNDDIGERLEGVEDESVALAAIADAAQERVDGLRALRPLIVARTGGARVEDVRADYLPHLDSWIDYLDAVSEDPTLLFTNAARQPYLLLINATAEVFRDALEELLASGPSVRAAELAGRILDDGFRSEGPPPTV